MRKTLFAIKSLACLFVYRNDLRQGFEEQCRAEKDPYHWKFVLRERILSVTYTSYLEYWYVKYTVIEPKQSEGLCCRIQNLKKL